MRATIASIASVLALSACSLLPVRTETVLLAPPAVLLEACSEPQGEPTTNGAMAELLLGYKTALRGCNDQLEAAREWVREVERFRR